MEEAAEAASAVRKGKPGCVVFLFTEERGAGGRRREGGRGDPVLHYGDPLFTPYPDSTGGY